MKERLKTIIHRRDLLRIAIAGAGAATTSTMVLELAAAKPVDLKDKRRHLRQPQRKLALWS